MMRERVCTKLVGLFLIAVLSMPHKPAAADDADIEFDIEAQELGAALSEFALQSGKEILFVESDVRGKTAPRLSGSFEPGEALDLLLADSNLEYRVSALDTLLIGETSSEVSSEPGNANPAPMPMAQATQSRMPSASRGPSEGETGTIAGKVTDARTGANLKGALIRLVGSDQVTSTDNLGGFLLSGVPTGRQTVEVSYLGYAAASASVDVFVGEAAELSFTLRGGSDIEEIVVYGQRSARAQALNQERTASNVSTVISSDLIGSFNATTISDALKRAPGVAFQENATGDASNIIVRGLAPDFNTLTLNGVELPVGNGEGRSASLENFLAEAIESVTISKTLLPSQDSSGTGGLVEIETKSPLDRPRRFASFLAEGAQRADDFSDEYLISGTVSGRFGDRENLGLSASVQYRDISATGVSYNHSVIFGEFLPLEADGSTSIRSTQDIAPEIGFPFDPLASGVYLSSLRPSFNENGSENLAITLSSEWQAGAGTTLRFDYQRSDVETTRFSRGVDLFTTLSYSEQPVNSLGGEVRQALGFTGRVRTSQTYVVNPGDTLTTDVLSFRGETDIANWEFDYNVGYTRGRQEVEFSTLRTRGGLRTLEDEFISPQAVDPIEGRVISLFDRRSGDAPQLPLLTQEGIAALTDLDNSFLSSFQTNGTEGKNDRYVGGFNARRGFDGKVVQYVEVGLQYEHSEFGSFFDDARRVTGAADLASLGFVNGPSDLSRIGISGGLPTPTLSSSQSFIGNAFAIAEGDERLTITSIEQDPLFRQTSTTEEEFAGFLQTQMNFGKLEVIGGLRISHVKVEGINRSGPTIRDEEGVPDLEFQEAFTRLIRQTETQTDLLPRVLMNYRPNEDSVLRAGYFLSVARPLIEDVSDDQRVTLDLRDRFGPNGDQPTLRVTEGNPALKPAVTHNFDISIEHYNKDIGVMKLGVFYKRVNDSIQLNRSSTIEDLAGVQLPDDPRFTDLPDNVFIQVTRPENAKDAAELWGVEVAYERQLAFLPGIWSGFGVFANYTYTDSARTEPVVWNQPIFDDAGVLIGREQVSVDLEDIRFDQQPAHSGTAAVTYNNYGIDASLSYSYQDRRPASFSPNGLSFFNEEIDSLDFRAEYRFDVGPANWRLYIEGTDLLDGTDDPLALVSLGGEGGTAETIVGGNYIGGREFKLGLIASF